ncbi:putative glutathione-specific gamma-glutamylcyclotransferase 2 isoform X2 [Melanaphis sacchari]|uniref:putative glutathione-specific gamma-glutamylcyclotransferase 2 isoform X2 n=1 Tax=Melanaphis sacchari TaxID=742174 RepID=UPI000DC13140|nr:putative glutathione-specific gamma-glutamylcyclotransferase 2 isoform X2 [Melanaphis sacchari]
MAEDPEYWVFGYGSLCWNPGFEFKDSMVGYVEGFSRKFWQGNIAHRGTKEKGFVWGKAFLLPDEKAFRYLEMREVYLGGYEVHKVDVRSDGADDCRRTVNATVYVATPDNGQWLGEAPVDELAAQVATCSGPAGHNAEYVILLARWERQHAPANRVDLELNKLELLVLEQLQMTGVRLDEVLTTNSMPSFSSMVPEKKLRCLNI